MFKFTRILLVVLAVLLFISMVCIGMVGCGKRLPANAVICPNCNPYRNPNHGYIAASDREEYHNVLCESYDIVNVVNRYKYSGTMEGHEEADGFLIFYKSRSNISGSINEEETYEFYYQKSDGGYKKMSVPVDSATIYYTDEQPHVEICVEYGWYWVCDECGTENYNGEVNFYKIYVPEGSITEKYELN